MADRVVYIIDDDDEPAIPINNPRHVPPRGPTETPPVNPPVNPPVPANNPPVNPPVGPQGGGFFNAHNRGTRSRYVAPLLTQEYMLSDEDVVDSRPLPAHANKNSRPPFQLTVANWDSFLDDIFKSWDTRSQAPANPVMPLRKFHQTHIQVGRLKHDHPLADAQLRDGARVQKIERTRGAPVFFGLTPNYETGCVQWFWRDAKCASINPDHVTLDEGMDSHTIRRDALKNYNFHKLPRMREHNLASNIACARRAIKKWVEAGTGRYCHLDYSDIPSDLKLPVLATVMAQNEGRRLVAASAEAAENFEHVDDEVI
ncbi:hypothetical protein ACHAP5_009628 [Fusarium lateritium]